MELTKEEIKYIIHWYYCVSDEYPRYEEQEFWREHKRYPNSNEEEQKLKIKEKESWERQCRLIEKLEEYIDSSK